MTDLPTRQRLDNRRECEAIDIEIGGHKFTAWAGFDPNTGAVRELFLGGVKPGSHLDTILNDAAVVVSVALQHGVPAEALGKSVSRVDGVPASPIGAALDFLVKVQKEE